MTSTINGWTDERFDAVAATFAQYVAEVGDGGAAFSAIVGGQTVVDLWTGQKSPGQPWAQDTVSACFSATKALTATCVALLHDRGLLDVDAPVARYWPEFAVAGKSEITVRQLLSHTAGMIEIPGYAEFMHLDGTGWDDLAEIRRRLAAATPAWAPGSMHGYHVMTFGYLAGTLVELIDGRPLAQFFDEEFRIPLDLDLRIGAPDDVLPRMSTLIEPDLTTPMAAAIAELTLKPSHDPTTLAGRACIAQHGEGCLDHLAVMGGDVKLLRSGGGFGDGIGSARSLAAFYARLLDPRTDGPGPSSQTMKTFTEPQCRGADAILNYPSSFALGYQCNVELAPGVKAMGPSMTAFGHGGAGGQVGFGDPENGVAIGFVRSHLALASPLAAQLVGAVYQIVGSS